MAKYNLFVNGVEVPSAGRSKKDAVIKIGEATGRSFSVRTDKGSEVYAIAVEAPVEEPEDLIGDDTPAETSEPVEQEETLFYEHMDFPGNYSIVTAPGATEIAEAAGVPTRTTNTGGLTRRVEFGGEDMDLVTQVMRVIKGSVDEAFEDLHAWQKKHIERRRGLTDMQRYVEHREFIAKQMHKTALAVKKSGLV
jgi:hypothetical protein